MSKCRGAHAVVEIGTTQIRQGGKEMEGERNGSTCHQKRNDEGVHHICSVRWVDNYWLVSQY